MDIDDILREVDPSHSSGPDPIDDLQILTRLWVAERSSPELLAWPTDGFFERLNDRIKRQIEHIEDMTGDMDPKATFALVVIQTELERFKYLVRSYLRARISKLDAYTLHYLSTPELRGLLSETELAYATRHQALLHNHYLASFLGGFPTELQNLNDTGGGVNMIDAPDEDATVFARVLAKTAQVSGMGTDADNTIEAEQGDVLVLRWASAKPLVQSRVLELV
ncbi:GINS complex subunit [Ceratocystis pirilliformis]|uniref:DNA replication complex GINS protein SLD5 n=1 Tax=Ceratocystis pirilliformis TaxID=259994 RepID=A0ABR3YHM7_9PEZI